MAGVEDHEQLERVKERFTRTAEQFAKFSLAKRSAEAEMLMELALPHLRDAKNASALDVACGPGTFTCALAAQVGRVVGLDLTAALMAQAQAAAVAQKLTNVTFTLGQAERLPWPAGQFDVVTCGYSLHHMLEPAQAVAEMRRVLRREASGGGCVAIVDLVVPGERDARRAELHTAIERARDSSHATSLPASELRALVEGAGLRMLAERTAERVRSFDDWMRICGSQPGDATYRETRRLMEATIGDDAAGFHGRAKADGDLEFVQTSYFVAAR